ncbi:trigger factor [Pasteuria penetrans]|uniref:trigger factor n=1 Tax=Pasteuria penetrans TaxID=86005 RepID=UPI0011EF8289|nr:trigger factor [Pasteuria penetrans]
MVKTLWERIDDSAGFVKVELGAESVKEAFKQAVATVGRKYLIPGFRPGRAPQAIFEARFGKDILVTEAKHHLVDRTGNEAVAEVVERRGIELESAEVDQQYLYDSPLEKGKPFHYRIRLSTQSGSAPSSDVMVPSAKKIVEACQGVSVELDPPLEVTEEDVDRVVEEFRLAHATWHSLVKGETVQAGDRVKISFVAMDDFDTEEEARRGAQSMLGLMARNVPRITIDVEGEGEVELELRPSDSGELDWEIIDEGVASRLGREGKEKILQGVDLQEKVNEAEVALRSSSEEEEELSPPRSSPEEGEEGNRLGPLQFIVGKGAMVCDLERGLLGQSVGEMDTHVLHFPKEHPAVELAGRWVAAIVDVVGADRPELPDLSDELANEVAEVETVSEWRQKIRKDLEVKRIRDYNSTLENLAVREASQRWFSEVEASSLQVDWNRLIQSGLDDLWRMFAKRLSVVGVSIREYLEVTKSGMDDLKEQLIPVAEQKARQNVFLYFLADALGFFGDEGEEEKEREETEQGMDRAVDWLLSISDHPGKIPVDGESSVGS